MAHGINVKFGLWTFNNFSKDRKILTLLAFGTLVTTNHFCALVVFDCACEQSRRHGVLVGVTPPNKVPSSPKLKGETL